MREVIDRLKIQGKRYDNIMLLQPTSPLRTEQDIISSFDLMTLKNANAILSITEAEHSPLWCNTIEEDLCMDHFRNEKYAKYPRQMLPKYYRLNGAIYLLKTEELHKQKCLLISVMHILCRKRDQLILIQKWILKLRNYI